MVLFFFLPRLLNIRCKSIHVLSNQKVSICVRLSDSLIFECYRAGRVTCWVAAANPPNFSASVSTHDLMSFLRILFSSSQGWALNLLRNAAANPQIFSAPVLWRIFQSLEFPPIFQNLSVASSFSSGLSKVLISSQISSNFRPVGSLKK